MTSTAREGRLSSWLPFVAFFASPLMVYPWRFVRAGLLDGGDDALSNLPLLLHSARHLLRLEIFWTPSQWLGTPLLDEPEFGTLYLPRLLMLPFRPIVGFTLYVLLHYVLAQASMYLYTHSLGVSRKGAMFGAFVYGFCGFMLGHRGHTMYLVAGAWSPLVFFFLRRAELRVGRFNYLGAAAAFAAVPLAGAAQLTVYLAATLVAVHAMSAIFARENRALVVGSIGVTAGLLLAMPQILPSLAFVSELVKAPRLNYDVSVLLSYDPRLLPLLVIPHDPLGGAELFSHVGAVALVFAVAALVRDRRALVWSWGIVTLSALVLMVGWHVPLLPRLLHRLPVIDVLRGPARHNFELGLGTSVLAAFGFDVVFERTSLRPRTVPWLVAAVASMPILFLLVRFMQRSKLSLDQAGAVAAGIRPGWVLAGTVILGLAFAVVAFSATRLRPVLGAFVLMAPILEAWMCARPLDRVWPDYASELDRAVASIGKGEERIFPVPIGDLASVSGNATLLLPNVQGLYGYASMANRDSAVLFDLDMLGHPRALTDLAWSRLPTIFGIDTLILPETRCDPLDFAVGPGGVPANSCVEHGAAPASLAQRGSVGCLQQLDGGIARFGVDLDLADAETSPKIVVGVRSEEGDIGYQQATTVGFAHHLHVRRWLRKGHVPQHGSLFVAGPAHDAAVFDSITLMEERLERVADPPTGSDGSFETPDTHDEPSPPDSAHRHGFQWPRGPQSVQIRGTGAFAGLSRPLLQVPGAMDGTGVGFTQGRKFRIEENGYARFEYHLASRPVTVTVTVDATLGASLGFGFSYSSKLGIPPSERWVEVPPSPTLERFTFTADVPGEVGQLQLEARPGFGPAPRFLRLAAVSACSLRDYRAVRPIGKGLEIYHNPNALPRVFTVGEVRAVHGLEEARHLLREDDGLDFRKTALVDGDERLPRLGPGAILEASFGGERVQVKVRTGEERPTFLVVNDRFHDRWDATVDGVPTAIYRTNGLVRGVVVPKGEHTVVMSFRASGPAKAGFGLALLGLGLALSGSRLERGRFAFRNKQQATRRGSLK